MVEDERRGRVVGSNMVQPYLGRTGSGFGQRLEGNVLQGPEQDAAHGRGRPIVTFSERNIAACAVRARRLNLRRILCQEPVDFAGSGLDLGARRQLIAGQRTLRHSP